MTEFYLIVLNASLEFHCMTTKIYLTSLQLLAYAQLISNSVEFKLLELGKKP